MKNLILAIIMEAVYQRGWDGYRRAQVVNWDGFYSECWGALYTEEKGQ